MNIIIGADIVPTLSNEKIFESGNITDIVDQNIISILDAADYRIFNLEVPLVDIESPIQKCGPCLRASTQIVRGLKSIGVNFLTLANNHIMDQGYNGLRSTMDVLDCARIAYAGAGDNIEVASKPYIIRISDQTVGIYCCAEHEFSIADKCKSGANPFDPLESLDHIKDLKSQCDYVICLYHGGKEHYRYPSPLLRKTCKKIIEKGANIVICQHTHCIGCRENYMHGTIVYGQGNFLFDYSDNECWQTSILINIDLRDNSVEYIPIRKNRNSVMLAQENDAQDILCKMEYRSKQIQQQGFIESEYDKFAESMLYLYFSRDIPMMGNILFKLINKASNYRIGRYLVDRRIRKNALTYINQYNCEAHRELILCGLEKVVRDRM